MHLDSNRKWEFITEQASPNWIQHIMMTSATRGPPGERSTRAPYHTLEGVKDAVASGAVTWFWKFWHGDREAEESAEKVYFMTPSSLSTWRCSSKLVCQRFWWPSVQRDVMDYVLTCSTSILRILQDPWHHGQPVIWVSPSMGRRSVSTGSWRQFSRRSEATIPTHGLTVSPGSNTVCT